MKPVNIPNTQSLEDILFDGTSTAAADPNVWRFHPSLISEAILVYDACRLMCERAMLVSQRSGYTYAGNLFSRASMAYCDAKWTLQGNRHRTANLASDKADDTDLLPPLTYGERLMEAMAHCDRASNHLSEILEDNRYGNTLQYIPQSMLNACHCLEGVAQLNLREVSTAFEVWVQNNRNVTIISEGGAQ